MRKVISIAVFTIFAGILLSGCIISHHSHISDSSGSSAVTKTQMKKIEPGVTTKDWIIDNFGEPDREKHLPDGEEIIVYENTKHKSSHVSLFLIFSSHTTEEIKESVSFKIKDGIVKSYWID